MRALVPLRTGIKAIPIAANHSLMLFGSSGIRRAYGRDLVDLSLSLGSAIGGPGADILLGRDTRTTGPVLSSLVSAGILGSGGNVRQAGIAPTPAIAYGARKFSAGIMITASHNPEAYNGFKLFRPDGSSYAGPDQMKVEKAVCTPAPQLWDRQGVITAFDAVSPYIEEISTVRRPVERVKVVLDCGNGAGCTVTPRLLDRLGVAVSCINCTPQGRFARPSEPLEENLTSLPAMVRTTGSAGAIAHDGDADRMMAFDNRGRFISGDRLMMLFIRYLGVERVVTTFDASMAIEEIADVKRTPVGDTFVSAELAHWGQFGGEPSGAWIFPSHSLCPDGPYAAALFCEIASVCDIAREIDAMPSYPVIRESYPCDNAKEILTALDAPSTADGIRISHDDGWVLVRASGTEPKIRITAEGKDRMKARKMLEEGRQLVRKGKSMLE
jgi:phosphoglucosamine mutase